MGIVTVKDEPVEERILVLEEYKKTGKKRRLVEVIVPTMKEIERRRRADAVRKREAQDQAILLNVDFSERKNVTKREMQAEMEKHRNPKAKVKVDNACALGLDSVYNRLSLIGHEHFEVQLEPEILEITVTREFMSKNYGGNTEQTFPSIGKQWTHGMKAFMYSNLDYNPHAPQRPGAPGLFYSTRGSDDAHHDGRQWHEEQMVFCRLDKNIWSHCGRYKLTAAPALTKEEWLSQREKVRHTWATKIAEQSWGRHVRCRIALRRELGRVPTDQEASDALNSGNKFSNVTVDEIAHAYDTGDEHMQVWCMKCVGYDEAFQREIVRKLSTWKPEPKEKKATPRRARPGPTASKTKGTKRKRSEVSEPSGGVDEEVETENDNVQEQVYVPRGTRSRPK